MTRKQKLLAVAVIGLAGLLLTGLLLASGHREAAVASAMAGTAATLEASRRAQGRSLQADIDSARSEGAAASDRIRLEREEEARREEEASREIGAMTLEEKVSRANGVRPLAGDPGRVDEAKDRWRQRGGRVQPGLIEVPMPDEDAVPPGPGKKT